jgi:hypothetical protein
MGAISDKRAEFGVWGGTTRGNVGGCADYLGEVSAGSKTGSRIRPKLSIRVHPWLGVKPPQAAESLKIAGSAFGPICFHTAEVGGSIPVPAHT